VSGHRLTVTLWKAAVKWPSLTSTPGKTILGSLKGRVPGSTLGSQTRNSLSGG
jgi:hypothetical protein